MNSFKISLVLVLLAVIDFHQCARYGGSRGRGGGSYTRRPHPPPSRRTTSRPRSTAPTSSRPPNYQSTRRPYPTGTTPSSGWNIPPRPGTYPQQSYQGPQKVTIKNKYNYNYPGHYSLPVQNPSHPGYFYTPTSYHYSSSDTGSTALGFFLGYSLARLTTPTFSHYSFYDGYRPRYDHYTVHHYYHNKNAVPQNQEIQSNTIVGCVGDSVTVCPSNTTSLCTSNGALMCVVSATSTVPCTDNRQVNCVKSVVPCVNNTAPECKNSNQNATTVSIPCISNAKVYGDVKTVNNTIVTNSTNANSTTSSTQYPITTTPVAIVSSSDGTTSTYSTKYPITTTPEPSTNPPVRKKRETAQNFCVTIVALPAEKKPTEGELFLKDAKSIVEKFIESAWNL
ncbi:mucin-2 [Tribolium castaneum]|uniref:mucin-2 n=1 Tax=Tribolium castaneum TaxID=7070 RepID=UPI0030FE85B4